VPAVVEEVLVEALQEVVDYSLGERYLPVGVEN
jgi:hypothetical protein